MKCLVLASRSQAQTFTAFDQDQHMHASFPEECHCLKAIFSPELNSTMWPQHIFMHLHTNPSVPLCNNSTAITRILHSQFQALHPDYIYLPSYSNNHMYAVLNNQYTTYKTLHRCLQSLRVSWRCTGVSHSMAEVPSSCLLLHSHNQKDILL